MWIAKPGSLPVIAALVMVGLGSVLSRGAGVALEHQRRQCQIEGRVWVERPVDSSLTARYKARHGECVDVQPEEEKRDVQRQRQGQEG